MFSSILIMLAHVVCSLILAEFCACEIGLRISSCFQVWFLFASMEQLLLYVLVRISSLMLYDCPCFNVCLMIVLVNIILQFYVDSRMDSLFHLFRFWEICITAALCGIFHNVPCGINPAEGIKIPQPMLLSNFCGICAGIPVVFYTVEHPKIP